MYALEKANDGFMVSDGKGKMLYFNEAYAELTNFDKSIVIGSNIREYISSGYISQSSCLRAINEKKLVKMVHNYPNRTAVIVASKPILDYDGNVEKVITNFEGHKRIYGLDKRHRKHREAFGQFFPRRTGRGSPVKGTTAEWST